MILFCTCGVKFIFTPKRFQFLNDPLSRVICFHIPVLRAIKAWQPRLKVDIRKTVTFDEDFRLSQRTPGNEGNIFAISADDLGQGNLSDLSHLASGECRFIGVQVWVRCILMPKTISLSEASKLFSYNTAKGITHKTSRGRCRFR